MIIIKIFWNPEDRRLRALWRILLQTVIFVLLTAVASYLTMQIPASFFASKYQINLSDPNSTQQIMEIMNQVPWLNMLSAIAITAATVLSIWFSIKFFDRRSWANFGLKINAAWLKDFYFGMALGAILMVFIFLVELAVGWITITDFLKSTNLAFIPAILLAIFYYLLVSIREEFLSRGYHLRNIAEGLNLRWLSPQLALLAAYLLSSAVFGFAHAANPNSTIISTINLIAAGIFLGFGYVLTGNLAIPLGLHLTWNFFQGNIFGFPVSGMSTSVSLFVIQQNGPNLWTGGNFGPEAGIMGIIAILIGMIMTYFWVRHSHGKANIQYSLAEYQRPNINAVPEQAANIDTPDKIQQQ